jgi:hypothetical protein
MGPLDLIDVETFFDTAASKVKKLFVDPTISDGPLAQVVNDLKALPSTSTITRVARNLDSFQKSLDWLAPGTTIDFNTSLTYWSNTVSQGYILGAVQQLETQPGTSRAVAQLKIISGIQRTMGDYLNILVTTGTDPGSVWITTQLALKEGNLPDSVIMDLIQAEMDLWCVQNGGVVINPGSGYSAHTCTWATKEDCHGAFPWTESETTPTTTKLLCAGSTPAPCPVPSPTPGCIPNGSYSPASGSDCCSQADIDADGKCQPVDCPPPVPKQLSPCPALQDPNGADLTYTEWRNKDWFTASGTPWAPIINASQIPSGGACIQENPAIHILCDEEHTTARTHGRGVKNSYDRVHGMCINTPEYCFAKGISYGDVLLTDMGVGNDMAPLVGAYNAQSDIIHGTSYPSGPALKSCYENIGQTIVAEIGFGETIARGCIPEQNEFDAFINDAFNVLTSTAPQLERFFNQLFTPEGMEALFTTAFSDPPPRTYAPCPPGHWPVPGDPRRCLADNPQSTAMGVGAISEGNCLQIGTGNPGTATATTYGPQWYAGQCIQNSQCPPCLPGKKPDTPLRRKHCECVPATEVTDTNQFGVPLCIGATGMSLDGFSCTLLTAGTLGQTNPACPYYVADSSGKYNFCRTKCPPGSIAGTGLTYGLCFDSSGNSIFKGPPATQFSYPG